MKKLYYIVLDQEKQNKEKGIVVLIMSGQRVGWLENDNFICDKRAIKKLNEYNINYKREKLEYKR